MYFLLFLLTNRFSVTTQLNAGACVKFGEFKHHVAIGDLASTAHICSGSIVSERWILTTRKCVEAIPPDHLMVTLNKYYTYSRYDKHSFSITMKRPLTFLHPDFDVTMIKLPVSLVFVSNLTSIRLNRGDVSLSATNLVGMFPGYAYMTKGSGLATLPFEIRPASDCKRLFEPFNENFEFCGYSFMGLEYYPSFDDLGNGLVINGVLVGVSTQFYNNLKYWKFAHIDKFVQWVDDIMKNNTVIKVLETVGNKTLNGTSIAIIPALNKS